MKERKRITPEEYAAKGTEHAHQVALFMWIAQALNAPMTGLAAPRFQYGGQWYHYDRDLLEAMNEAYAIPNGGGRGAAFGNMAVVGRLKAEGVKPGVSDIFVPIMRPRRIGIDPAHNPPVLRPSHWGGLYIEMKRPGDLTILPKKLSGVVSDDQQAFLDRMAKNGYATIVCYGWEPARYAMWAYLR